MLLVPRCAQYSSQHVCAVTTRIQSRHVRPKEQRAPLLYTTVLSSTGLVCVAIEADTLDEQNTGFYFGDIYQKKMSNNSEKPFFI